SIVDEAIIVALYRASEAGVPVELLVGGICGVKPGVEGLSGKIDVRSILGRYLEHSRIFSFINGGDPQVYIGRADLMHRNLDRRVEAHVRLTNPEHLREIEDLFDLAMSDDTAHWKLAADGSWTRHYRADDGSLLDDMQNVIMQQVSQRKRTGVVR
ncbi:MAG: RNA degradosome polyphosphate kinase, partial [Candidatus Saccharibacteria bacterium]|nr:RNA degradosome polyphosphate kinase [Microbacteriaceae bacterium]